MKLSHGPGVQFLVASLLAGLAFFLLYQDDIYRYRYKPTALKPTDWVAGRPAGEITQDYRLVQSLRVEEADVHSREFAEPFCVNLLMANYANRRNRGSFAVIVNTEEGREEKILQARDILDNDYERVCFETLRFEQIHRRPATLEISGIDGQAGSSVTAWLSAAPTGGRATVNGQPTELTLVHTIVLLKDSRNYQVNAYVLMVFAALLVALLLTAIRNPKAI